jgi:ubiquinone/menaquinone biosynthesis C-methylase UbiE
MANSFSQDFEHQVVEGWSNRTEISNTEAYLLPKYLKNNTLKVLEAGTGAGVFSFYIEEELGFTHVKGFDVLSKMIEIASFNASKRNSKVVFFQADAANLEAVGDSEFDYLIYLGQILSMVPKSLLENSLSEAYRIGNDKATYIFSFLDWDSRWYNPLLSLVINTFRLFRGEKIEKYYLPEIKTPDRSINWRFYKKKQQGILWVKNKHAIGSLKKVGFNIIKSYQEEELTNYKGRAIYIICEK